MKCILSVNILEITFPNPYVFCFYSITSMFIDIYEKNDHDNWISVDAHA